MPRLPGERHPVDYAIACSKSPIERITLYRLRQSLAMLIRILRTVNQEGERATPLLHGYSIPEVVNAAQKLRANIKLAQSKGARN